MGGGSSKPQYPENFTYNESNHFTNSKNKRIYCHYWLPEQTPRALVFIAHGVGEHCQRYGDLAELLVQQGLLVYSHDHVGHGLSEGDRVHVDCMDIYYNDVKQHVDMMKKKYPNLPTFIIGHSMGGTIAIGTVLRNPDLFQGMVMIGPAIKQNPEAATPLKVAGAKVVAFISPQMGVGAVDSAWISRDKQVQESYDADPLVYHHGLKAKWAVNMLYAMNEIQKRVGEVKVPYLIVHGDQDKLCLLEGSQLFLEKSSSQDKKLSVYEGGYHQVHNEPDGMGEQCMEEIRDWIVTCIPSIEDGQVTLTPPAQDEQVEAS